MAQGRSTKIIPMMKWIRTCRLSIKNSLSLQEIQQEEKTPSLRGSPPPTPFALPLTCQGPHTVQYMGTSLIRNAESPKINIGL